MSSNSKSFYTATKGKVILGFLMAGLALLLAWGISKFVFEEILGTVEKISAPNDKLRIVNKISHQIASLDHLQKESKNRTFLTATKNLKQSLDTLTALYTDNEAQLARISTLQRLLGDMDKQFLLYLEVRGALVNTQSFSEEVEKLTELLIQRAREADSTIYTTQTATSITTLAPDEEQKSRGFLSRLFGKKKSEVYKIIDEEYKVKKDSLNPQIQDSIMQGVENTLKAIEIEQREKSDRFLKREAELAGSSRALTKQMLDVLKEVEAEAFMQIDKESMEAKTMVSEGVYQIKIIIVAFFVITLVLGGLIIADITRNNKYRLALEKAKEEAEYHGRAKQRFLSNMSHEIRTPLQAILGYAEFVSQQKQPDKKHINAIHSSAVHLLQIVNEVLDYSRITSGEFNFEKKDFSLLKTLEEVIEAMRPLADQKKLVLLTDLKLEKTDWVKGDAFRLKQVLYNLIGNAIKFTVAGHVKLIAECKHHESYLHCYFTIEDTGVGIAEENQDKIFKEFEQADMPEKEVLNQNGTGLGLSIVKTLVEAQAGRISAKSKLGEGSSFSVYLKYEMATMPVNEVEMEGVKVQPTGMVWVIDDDQLILNLCELIFGQYHIPFKTFSTAQEILTSAVDEQLEYVLIDMRLENITGVELYRQLKKRLPKQVKYYAITAQVLPDEQQQVLAEGFEGIIMKPFKAEDLLKLFPAAVVPDQHMISFDDNALLKMTMGDQELMVKILHSFKQDCEADIESLQQYVQENNIDHTRLLVHRLAGRIGQIGAKELATKFRELEQKIATAEETIAPDTTTTIANLIAQLDLLLHTVEERIYSVS